MITKADVEDLWHEALEIAHAIRGRNPGLAARMYEAVAPLRTVAERKYCVPEWNGMGSEERVNPRLGRAYQRARRRYVAALGRLWH